MRRMTVMNQKSVLSRAMAKPPRRTTVAHMKLRVPSPVAAFSSTASRRAKSVSFFSGALTAAFAETEFSVLLFFVVISLLCGANMVGSPPVAAVLSSDDIWRRTSPYEENGFW
nr:Os07g0648050 [Ipomoea trifida]